MKFRVHSEAGSYFLLDVADAHMQTLETYAAAENVPVHVALQTILETEIGRVYRDLQEARETFDVMGPRELGLARAAYVGDRDRAVQAGNTLTARFCRGRIALIDQVLAERSGAQQP